MRENKKRRLLAERKDKLLQGLDKMVRVRDYLVDKYYGGWDLSSNRKHKLLRKLKPQHELSTVNKWVNRDVQETHLIIHKIINAMYADTMRDVLTPAAYTLVFGPMLVGADTWDDELKPWHKNLDVKVSYMAGIKDKK